MKKLTGFAIFLIFVQIVLITLIIMSGTVISKSKDTFVKFNRNRNKTDQLTIESDFLNGENNSIDLANKIRPGMGQIYGMYEEKSTTSHKYEKPYSVINPLKHKEKWVLEYDPYFGPKRKVEVTISYKNGVKVNSIENDQELIDIIPKDILRKKNLLDQDFLENNPKLKNYLFYEDKELTKPINTFKLTNDEIDKLTDIYAVDINKGDYNYTIEYRKHNSTGELIDFSNTNLVNIYNYDPVTKQFKGKGNKNQIIPIMHPRLLGFKPKEPNKISFKLENNNVTITVVYEKNIADYHQVIFYSGNFGKINGQTYYEVLKNDKTLAENGIIAPSVTPVKGKLFTGWEPIFDPDAKLTETKVYVAKYVDDPSYTGEYNYTINYLVKGTNQKVPTISPNPKTGKGTLAYALSITTPTVPGYEVAKNEAFEVIINEGNNVTINVFYVENNKHFSYKVTYVAKLEDGTEREIPYPPQEGYGRAFQEVLINHPIINGYNLIPNQIDRITLVPDDSQNRVKIYYTVNKIINNFEYKVNYLIKDTNTSIHPQTIGYGYAFQEIDILPHPVIPGYKQVPNNPTKVVVLSDGSAEVNVYYEVDQGQKIYNYQIEFYIKDSTNPVPGKTNISGQAYINQEITVDVSPVPGFKVVSGTPNKYSIDQNNKVIKVYYEVDTATSNYEGYVYYYIEGTTDLVPGISPNPVKYTGHYGKIFNIDHPINNHGYKVKANQPTQITIQADHPNNKVEVFYEVDKTQKVYDYTINYLIKGTSTPVPGSTKKTGKAYIGEIITIDFPTINGYKVVGGSSTTLKVDHNPSEIDIYYEVDTNVQTFTGRVNYYIKGTTNPVPGVVTHEIVNGYIGEVKTINAPLSTEGYKLDPTTPLPITLTIKQDNTAEINVYYVIDENQKIYNYKVYYYLQGTTDPVPGKPHILNGKAYINENITLDTTPVTGYKAVNNQNTVVTIDGDNKEFTIYYEVNTSENNFEGKVYYKIEGTDQLVPGLAENPKKFKGSADEIVSITPHPTTNTGYKVKSGQPTNIKIKVDNSAELTVYYEVDKNQKIYSYSILFRIQGTSEKVPGVSDINGLAYINEEITIPLVNGNGYKPVAGSVNKLTVDENNKEITIYYELDKSQNQFTGKIKYYIEGDTKHVPGIEPNPLEVTGYHTQEIDIPHPVVNTGYKVKANQPTKITIKNDNSAEVIVEYVIDTSQEVYNYEIRFIVRKTGQPVPGKAPLIGTAYINKEITLDISNVNGYKAEAGSPTKVTINKNNFLLTVYYEPDNNVTNYKGYIEYRYKDSGNLVEPSKLGLLNNPVEKMGHVLQEFDVEKPNLTGYLVENAAPEKLVLNHENTAKVVVYYIVNAGDVFHGKVYLRIKGTTNPVPGHPDYISVTGNADQEVTFTVPFINGTGYKPEEGQEYKITIKADGTAEKTINYIVDQNQKIYNYTIKYLIKGLNTPVPGKPEVTGKAYIKEKININLDPVHGYKPASGNDVEVMITHDNQVIDIYYEVNQNDNDFKGRIDYKIKGTNDPVPGITPNPLRVTGYVGQKITIPTPLGTGYKVEAGQDLTLEILYDNSANKTIYYVVDQSQLIYEYSVYYYIKDTVKPVPGKTNIINQKAYINQEIDVDLTPGNGYKVVAGTSDKYTIDIANKVIKIYYEIDQAQTHFTGKVNYYIKNTTNPVPGIVANQTFNGYVGQEITITPPTTNQGYKLDPSTVTPIKLVIKDDNSAEIDVYYVIDETQKVYKYNIYYYLGQTGETPVPGKPHILDQDAYINENILINKDNVKGYKPIDGQIGNFNVAQNPTNIIIRYEINKLDKSFTGKVNYKIKGTNENVPGLIGIVNNPETLTGYLGEEVPITHYLSNLGYKVDDNQPNKLKLKYDNTAETTVYYVVDESQKVYTYNIYYYIQGTTNLVPGKTHKLNQKAYINEPINIDLSNGTGYKPLSTMPSVVNIDQNNKNIIIEYEINTGDNNFIGTVKYKLENGNDVPGIAPNPRTVTGYIGEVKNIIHPTLTNGYKVRDGEPNTITISGDNSAEITVYYVVDQSQKVYNYRINYYIDQTTNPVPGKDHVTGTAYIGEVITIDKAKTTTGYMVKPGQEDQLTVDSNNKEINIYYIVDQTQLVNTYNIYYKIKGTNDPVPGKANILNQKAYVGQLINVNINPTTTGYKAVEGSIDKFTVDNDPTNIEVFYEIDKSQNQFKGTVKYLIEGTNQLVPGIAENPKEVRGYHTQTVPVSHPIVNTGYKVKAGEPSTITIKNDNSSEITVYYVVDQTQKVYKYNIYYYLVGTTNPVPGKPHIENREAYIGEIINIDLNPTTTGYKAKSDQQHTLKVENPVTSINIYYEIDTNQTPYNYTIEYYIKDTTDPVPGKVNITSRAYINQVITLDKSNGIGYKVVSGTPDTITISSDNFRYVIYYEVDQSQNQFIGTVKYYVKGSTVEVPGIPETPGMTGESTKIAKGYVGQEIDIPHPAVTTGYKVMANQPTKITIKHDNTATEIVYYEIDETQLIWKYSILYRVHPTNEPIPYRPDIINEPAYREKKVSVDISPIAGYKLYGSPSNELIVDEDGKSVTIYYEIDTNQKFRYQVDYVNEETNEIIKESLIGQAPVGKLNLTHPVISGYQIVPGQNNFITVNNTGTAKLTVKYSANIDTNYSIEHYQEQLDGSFVLQETVAKQGKTDTLVNHELINYTGFTFDASNSDNILSGKVKGDGTLVLKVYYIRNRYNVTFDTKGGNVILPKEYKYNQEIGVLETPVKLGYIFVNWKDKSNNLVVNPTDKVTSDLNLYAEYNLQNIVVNITGYTGPTTYDGNPIHLTAVVTHPLANTATYRWTKDGVQIGTNKEIDINGVKESGKYKVEVTIDGVTVVKEIDIKINKANYDLSGLKFENKTVEYDTNVHKIEATGLPQGVTVKKYTNNTGTNAGVYNAMVEFNYDSDNYEPVPNLNAVLTITKANLTITADNANKVFNTNDPLEFTYVVSGFKGSDNISLLTGKLVRQPGENVGNYDILQGTLKANNNYNIQYNKGIFTINPAQIGGINIGSQTIVFDNQSHPAEVTGLLPGDIVEYKYNGITQTTPFEFTNAGVYKIETRVKRANHSDLVGELKLTIEKFKITLNINNANSNRLDPQANLTYTVVEPSNNIYPAGILINDIFELYVHNFNPNVAGKYQILVNEKMANNFEITYTPGEYTVNRLKHRARFVVDGEEYAVAMVYEGDNIPYPTANPTKLGYLFEKWTPSDIIMPENNITFTAVFKVDTSMSYSGKVYYRFRHNGELVPADRLGSPNPAIVTGHADELIPMTRYQVLGYAYENGQPLNIQIKADGTAEYTLYLVKDSSKWVEVNFVGGPNATLSGKQTYEMLKDVPLNDPRQYLQITVPTIIPNPGYFTNTVKWSPDFDLTESLSTSKTYTARVGKKYIVSVYDKTVIDYKAKQVVETGLYTYLLSHDGKLYVSVSVISQVFGVNPGKVGLIDPSNYDNKVIKSIHGRNGVITLVTEDNLIYGFKPRNVAGEFGQGNQNPTLGFVKVDPSTYDNKAIKSFFTGVDNSYLITTDGDVYGVGTAIGNGNAGIVKLFTKLDRNQFFDGRNIRKIIPMINNTIFLTEDNKAYMVGKNNFGIFGDTDPQDRLSPQLIVNPNLTNIIDADGYNNGAVWLNNRNELYVTGRNELGAIYPDASKLGQNITEFTKFDFLSNVEGQITNISLSFNSLLIGTDQNKLYFSGKKSFNLLGLPSDELLKPTLVDLRELTGKPIQMLQNNGFGYTIKIDGKLYYAGIYYTQGRYIAEETSETAVINYFKEYIYFPTPYKQYEVISGEKINITDLPYTKPGYYDAVESDLFTDPDKTINFVNNSVIMPERNYNLFFEFRKDNTKWVRLRFESGPNASFNSGNQIFEIEVLKGIPLNGIGQPSAIIPEIVTSEGYFVNEQPWDVPITMDSIFNADTTIRARVNKKYKVNVYTKIPADYNVKKAVVEDGYAFGAVLTHDNELYISNGSVSELGQPANTTYKVPLSHFENKQIKNIFGNRKVLYVQTADNSLYVYKNKSNNYGNVHLGLGFITETDDFIKVNSATYNNESIKDIQISPNATVILGYSGYVYGVGDRIVIGLNSNQPSMFFEKVPNSYFNNRQIIKISVNYHVTYYLTEENKLWVAGRNTANHFGIGPNKTNEVYRTPGLFTPPHLQRVIDISSTDSSAVLVNDNNDVYGVGDNSQGHVGQIGVSSYNKFTKLNIPSTIGTVVSAQITDKNLLLLTSDNKLYFKGSYGNEYFYLPGNSTPITLAEINSNLYFGETITSISSSDSGHFVNLTSGKVLYSGATSLLKNIRGLGLFKYKPEPYKTYDIVAGDKIKINDLPYTILGYNPITKLYNDTNFSNEFVNNSITMPENNYNLYVKLEKDVNQWTTVEFVPNEYSTLTGITRFDVIKGLPINHVEQPLPVYPPVINPAPGCKIDPNSAWDGGYQQDMVVDGPRTFTARVIKEFKVKVHEELDPKEVYNNKFVDEVAQISEPYLDFHVVLTKDGKLYVKGNLEHVPFLNMTGYSNEYILVDSNLYDNNEIDMIKFDETVNYTPITAITGISKPVKPSGFMLTKSGHVYTFGTVSTSIGFAINKGKGFHRISEADFGNAKIVNGFISCGTFTFITEKNQMFLFGNNENGVIPYMSSNDVRLPSQYEPQEFLPFHIKDVITTYYATLILLKNGDVYISRPNTNRFGKVKFTNNLLVEKIIYSITYGEMGRYNQVLLLGKDKKIYFASGHSGYFNQIYKEFDGIQRMQDLPEFTPKLMTFYNVNAPVKDISFGKIRLGTDLDLADFDIMYATLNILTEDNKLHNADIGSTTTTIPAKQIDKMYLDNIRYMDGTFDKNEDFYTLYREYSVYNTEKINIPNLPYQKVGYLDVNNLYKEKTYQTQFNNNVEIMGKNDLYLYFKREYDNVNLYNYQIKYINVENGTTLYPTTTGSKKVSWFQIGEVPNDNTNYEVYRYEKSMFVDGSNNSEHVVMYVPKYAKYTESHYYEQINGSYKKEMISKFDKVGTTVNISNIVLEGYENISTIDELLTGVVKESPMLELVRYYNLRRYTINFDISALSSASMVPQEVRHGDKLQTPQGTEPSIPEIRYWSKLPNQTNLSNLYNFDTPVTSEFTLYPILVTGLGNPVLTYPSKLVTNASLKQTLNSYVPAVEIRHVSNSNGVTYPERIETVAHEGKVYEKYNNEYYEYKLMQMFNNPYPGTNLRYQVTAQIIDYVYFDNTNNNYSTSYIKDYIKKIVSYKMGKTNYSIVNLGLADKFSPFLPSPTDYALARKGHNYPGATTFSSDGFYTNSKSYYYSYLVAAKTVSPYQTTLIHHLTKYGIVLAENPSLNNLYPQKKVANQQIIDALNGMDPEIVQKTFTVPNDLLGTFPTQNASWKLLQYGPHYYEKLGNNYYLFEQVEWVTANGYRYTKKIIDAVPFHRYLSDFVNYDNSYIKKYLDNVFMSKTKMSPADLFTEQQLYSPPFNSDESRKAICTDYAKAKTSDASLVNYNFEVFVANNEYYSNSYWTQTLDLGRATWVRNDGVIWVEMKNIVLGIRLQQAI